MPPRLAALAAVVLWGISFVATRAALREIPPVTLVFTRFGLGAALLLVLLLFRGRLSLPPRDAWPTLAAMGFLGVFLHQMVQAHALEMTTAVHAGWLIAVTPIWAALLGALLLRERLSPVRVGGLLLGFAGALLVITRGELTGGVLALPSTRGDLLILATTVNWAVYSTFGRRTLARLGSAQATTFALLAGWLMVVPVFGLKQGWTDWPRLSAGGWAAVLFLGIGCSGLGYLLWYSALERLDTARVAAFLYLEPLVTLATAVALLGEPVHATTVVGGLIVLAGVFLVQQRSVAVPKVASGDLTPNVAGGDLAP
jgi:drug/metabolite transporter (DMT)-like permease